MQCERVIENGKKKAKSCIKQEKPNRTGHMELHDFHRAILVLVRVARIEEMSMQPAHFRLLLDRPRFSVREQLLSVEEIVVEEVEEEEGGGSFVDSVGGVESACLSAQSAV